eukprot:102589_1
MADDLGWGNVPWEGHNTLSGEIETPHMDALLREGLLLNRHYVDMGCSPTRASFQTGRLPIHVTSTNDEGLTDPTHGIPVHMTTIATKLKQAGYGTHLVGKWDGGFSTYSRIPTRKGYDTFYGYLSKSITYFSKLADNDCDGVELVDLWENGAPAFSSMSEVDGELYVELGFMNRVQDLIKGYASSDEDTPFFIMYSMHLVHYPNEIPEDFLVSFDNDESMCKEDNDEIWPGYTAGDTFQCRSVLQSQVKLMDHIIGKIANTLKDNDLWRDTLIVFSSDNGGSMEFDNTAGNNYPLRGAKGTFWEGGIRAASWVSGGFLPEERRGQIENGLMHIADWYATFCHLAGVDANDRVAIGHGLPETDSLSMWGLLSGKQADSPRQEVVISPYTLINGEYKLIKENLFYNVWSTAISPNSETLSEDALKATYGSCSDEGGCLFNVVDDPSEYHELSETHADMKEFLVERLAQAQDSIYTNEDSGTDACPSKRSYTYCGCWMAEHHYNFFVGPYQNLEEEEVNYDQSVIGGSVDGVTKEHMIGSMEPSQYYVYLSVFSLVFIAVIGFVKCFKSVHNSNALLNEKVNDIQGSSLYGATY